MGHPCCCVFSALQYHCLGTTQDYTIPDYTILDYTIPDYTITDYTIPDYTIT